jgi:hypothetical protein
LPFYLRVSYKFLLVSGPSRVGVMKLVEKNIMIWKQSRSVQRILSTSDQTVFIAYAVWFYREGVRRLIFSEYV